MNENLRALQALRMTDCTWNEWLNAASKIIPKNEAMEILIASCYFDIDPSWLIIHGDEKISERDQDDIVVQCASYNVERRQEGLPLAYVLNGQDFYGRTFWLGDAEEDRVLIPRPETEQTIDIIKKINPKTILDVGTGSGCIAITLALELPNATIEACDISENALYVARENAWSLGVEVKGHHDYNQLRYEKQLSNGGYHNAVNFIKSDLLSNITKIPDLIVANLPYVDENWDWIDKKALSYEPRQALYADDGGLALIKKLIDQAAAKKIKYLILEADPCQHKNLKNYAKTKNYHLIDQNDFILTFAYSWRLDEDQSL